RYILRYLSINFFIKSFAHIWTSLLPTFLWRVYFSLFFKLIGSDKSIYGLALPPPHNLSILPIVPEYKCSLYHYTNLRNFSSEKYFSADWDHLQRVAAYQEVGYPACLAFDVSAPPR